MRTTEITVMPISGHRNAGLRPPLSASLPLSQRQRNTLLAAGADGKDWRG
ncbi:MAG TPA: hypothetical protein VG122_22455 [Gemmata sp.]|nr:hypothetical protein [Gemmata sp.]